MRSVFVKIIAVFVVLIFVGAIVQRRRQDKKEEQAELEKPKLPAMPAAAVDTTDRLASAFALHGAGRTTEARAGFRSLTSGRTDLSPGLPEEADITFSRDGALAFVRPSEGDATYVVTRDGEVTFVTKGGVAADGPLLVHQDVGGGIAVLDSSTGRRVGSISGTPLAASNDGAFLVYAPTAARDLRVWDPRTSYDLRTLSLSSLPHHDGIQALPAMTIEEEGLATVDGRRPRVSEILGEGHQNARVSNDGHWLAALYALTDEESSTTPESIVFFNLYNGHMVTAVRSFRAAEGAFAPDGSHAYFVATQRHGDDDDEGIAVVDLVTPRVVTVLKDCNLLDGLDAPSIVPSADGRWLAISTASRVCVYNARTNRLMWHSPPPKDEDKLSYSVHLAFALNDNALVIDGFEEDKLDVVRVVDGTSLASGTRFSLTPAGGHTPLADSLRIASDHVVVALDRVGAMPPRVVTIYPPLRSVVRPLTASEQSAELVPPELVPARLDDRTLETDDARKGELYARARANVCSAGDLIIPSEYCAN